MATSVKRATVNLDRDLLDEAASALGTSGTTATLNGALADVVRRKRLHDLANTSFPDLTLESLEKMRRWRTDGMAGITLE